jgi:signal recognition particle subunit SRP54
MKKLESLIMFSNLTERLGEALKKIKGQARLTEDNIQETLRSIRVALLEADVALSVAKEFIAKVKEKALGVDVSKSLNPGQMFIKIVNEELTAIMGSEQSELNLKMAPPAVILMAGLQGSGKTTSSAKLAKFLQEKQKKTVLLVSCDIYRPAAIHQLEVLAKAIEAHFFPSDINQKPIDIALAALDHARRQSIDVVIVDTAGRLAIDTDMMAEIQALHKTVNPIETLFVVDSMTGQDAANTAKAFNDALPLTGVILSKTDGDARGGAALSVRYITGKPIKFLGVGEKTDALEAFYPDRMASRILGMGDMLSLIEEVQHKVDHQEAEKLKQKLKKGGDFDLQDFADQLKQMNKMGGFGSLLSKIPGIPSLKNMANDLVGENTNKQTLAMIDSMTKKERRFPDLIKGSRKLRITKGSGTQIQDLNRLMKQFTQMQKMMKKVSAKGGMQKMMRQMQNMPQMMQGMR